MAKAQVSLCSRKHWAMCMCVSVCALYVHDFFLYELDQFKFFARFECLMWLFVVYYNIYFVQSPQPTRDNTTIIARTKHTQRREMNSYSAKYKSKINAHKRNRSLTLSQSLRPARVSASWWEWKIIVVVVYGQQDPVLVNSNGELGDKRVNGCACCLLHVCECAVANSRSLVVAVWPWTIARIRFNNICM